MKSLFKSKKGSVMSVVSDIGIEILTLCLILALGALFLANIAANSKVTADANATKIVADLKTEYVALPSWVGIFILALIFLALFGVVKAIKNMNSGQ